MGEVGKGGGMESKGLPIHAVAGEIAEGIRDAGRVVLQAPTGSGKSTQVPQILLDAAGVEGAIVVLQPRRLAARMLARRGCMKEREHHDGQSATGSDAAAGGAGVSWNCNSLRISFPKSVKKQPAMAMMM